MRSLITHTLEKDGDEVPVNSFSENLALVDVESYPAFIDKAADYFDLMAHLSGQKQALTAMAWKAPDHAVNLTLRLTEDDHIFEQTRAHRFMIASGHVRSYGQMCLTTHERLFDSARHRTHTLLRTGRLPNLSPSRLLHVPPGIYSISVYYNGSLSSGTGELNGSEVAPKSDYTVLLHHYPFPPKRIAPVRLSGLKPWIVEGTSPPANVITSHARVW